MNSVDLKKTNSHRTIKTILIVLSIVVVVISLTGSILISDEGSVPLTSFESFYVYVIAIAISLYLVLTNKNANIAIIISIITYLWTYYLVNQMIELITDIQITVGTSFYIYLSSVIFLILSLFFNNKSQTSESKNAIQQEQSNDSSNGFNENNFIFTHYITGIKGIPLNTVMLLVNDIPDNSLNLIFNGDNKDNKTIKLPINTIKNISFATKVRMQNSSSKIEEHETKSILLSAAVFGGSPVLQLLGNSGFNNLFNSLSNNYDKVDYNAYYEITIETLINNQDMKLTLTSDTNPEEFIKQLSNQKQKNPI